MKMNELCLCCECVIITKMIVPVELETQKVLFPLCLIWLSPKSYRVQVRCPSSDSGTGQLKTHHFQITITCNENLQSLNLHWGPGLNGEHLHSVFPSVKKKKPKSSKDKLYVRRLLCILNSLFSWSTSQPQSFLYSANSDHGYFDRYTDHYTGLGLMILSCHDFASRSAWTEPSTSFLCLWDNYEKRLW